jgi:hypothetical protein
MNDNDTDPLYDSNPTDDEIKKSYMIYLKRELIHDDYDTYINNGLISNDVINTFRGSIGGGYKGHAKKGGKTHKKKKTKKNHTKKGGKTKQRRTKNKRR